MRPRGTDRESPRTATCAAKRLVTPFSSMTVSDMPAHHHAPHRSRKGQRRPDLFSQLRAEPVRWGVKKGEKSDEDPPRRAPGGFPARDSGAESGMAAHQSSAAPTWQRRAGGTEPHDGPAF